MRLRLVDGFAMPVNRAAHSRSVPVEAGGGAVAGRERAASAGVGVAAHGRPRLAGFLANGEDGGRGVALSPGEASRAAGAFHTH